MLRQAQHDVLFSINLCAPVSSSSAARISGAASPPSGYSTTTPIYEARSAGTEPGARVRVTAGHLGWAETIFVMERRHADRLQEKFADALRGKTVVVLRIPDKYPFQDPVLIALLREKLAGHLALL
jgi:predicted protein tyrosine phosphatase